MSFKLIDCDRGTLKDDFASAEKALEAARKHGLKDFEVHNASGKCVYWKLPGDIIPNKAE